MLDSFPRCVKDTRLRVVYSDVDLLEWLRLNNGVRDCWVSLYPYLSYHNEYPDWETAVIDVVMVVPDSLDRTTVVLRDNKVRFVHIRDDQDLILIPVLHPDVGILDEKIDYLKGLGVTGEFGSVGTFIRYPGTINVSLMRKVEVVEVYSPRGGVFI